MIRIAVIAVFGIFPVLSLLSLLMFSVYDHWKNKELYAQDVVNPMLGYINRRSGGVRFLPPRVSQEYAERVMGLTRAPHLDEGQGK